MLITTIVMVFFLGTTLNECLYTVPKYMDLNRTTDDLLAYIGVDQMIYFGNDHESFNILDPEATELEDYFIVIPDLLPPDWEISEYGEILFSDQYATIMKPGVDSRARVCAAARPLQAILPHLNYGVNLPEPVWDNYVSDITNSVNEDSIISIVGRLELFENRYWSNDSFPAARDWAVDWLEDAGCNVVVQTFPVSTDSSQNIIIILPGTVYPNKYYLFGAHLDSGHNDYEIFPGADDNASGSAAVMETARAMVQYEYEYSVVLCLWGAEEAGLAGSSYFADAAAIAGDTILGVLNLDMVLNGPSIGPSGYDIVKINYNDFSADLAVFFAATAEIYVPDLNTTLNYTTSEGSDHTSFWNAGYTAVGGNEFVYSQWYHTSQDLLEKYIDFFPFGSNAAKSAAATLASLAVPVELGISSTPYVESLWVTASPNPASKTIQIFVSGNTTNSVSIELFDISGRSVLNTSMETGTPSQLDIANLSSGIYLLSAASENTIATTRVVVLGK